MFLLCLCKPSDNLPVSLSTSLLYIYILYTLYKWGNDSCSTLTAFCLFIYLLCITKSSQRNNWLWALLNETTTPPHVMNNDDEQKKDAFCTVILQKGMIFLYFTHLVMRTNTELYTNSTLVSSKSFHFYITAKNHRSHMTTCVRYQMIPNYLHKYVCCLYRSPHWQLTISRYI